MALFADVAVVNGFSCPLNLTPGTSQRAGESGGLQLVHEPLGVQRIENPLPFGGAQGSGRGFPRRTSSLGTLPSVPRCPADSERHEGHDHADDQSELVHAQHQFFSSSGLSSGIPRSAETFFWTPMMSSACSSRFRRRAFSRSSSFTRGSTTRALGPRFLEPSAARPPCSTSRRQAVSRDEYSPSRRRRAPISPSSLQRSASRTIRSLYSEVNLRRWALAGTSGSGSCCGTGPAAHTLPSESPVALRAPSGSEESETCVSLGEPF